MSYISNDPSYQPSKRVHLAAAEESSLAIKVFDCRSFEDISMIVSKSATVGSILFDIASYIEVSSETLCLKRKITVGNPAFNIHKYVQIPLNDSVVKHSDALTDMRGAILESVPAPIKVEKNEIDIINEQTFQILINFIKTAEKNTPEGRRTIFLELQKTFRITNSELSERMIETNFFKAYVKASGIVLNSAYKDNLSHYMKEKYAYYDREIIQETRFVPLRGPCAKRPYENIVDECAFEEESDLVEKNEADATCGRYKHPITKKYLIDNVRYKVNLARYRSDVEEGKSISTFVLDGHMQAPNYTFVFPDSKDPIHVEAFTNFVIELKKSINIDFIRPIDDALCRKHARNALNELIREHFINKQ